MLMWCPWQRTILYWSPSLWKMTCLAVDPCKMVCHIFHPFYPSLLILFVKREAVAERSPLNNMNECPWCPVKTKGRRFLPLMATMYLMPFPLGLFGYHSHGTELEGMMWICCRQITCLHFENMLSLPRSLFFDHLCNLLNKSCIHCLLIHIVKL